MPYPEHSLYPSADTYPGFRIDVDVPNVSVPSVPYYPRPRYFPFSFPRIRRR